MADEKVNVSPEESKTPEAPAPSGPGDPPAPEHTEGPAVPGGDQAAPSHAEPSTPEQSVIPGMGEDAPAPSGKVIELLHWISQGKEKTQCIKITAACSLPEMLTD